MPADIYSSNVSLLLNCDGANNSTVFTDDSSLHKTIVTNGDAKIVTDVATPFGDYTGVAKFDGTGDYLNIAGSTDYSMDAGDFTMECWVNLITYKPSGHFITISPDGNSEIRLQQNASNALEFRIYHSSGYQVTLSGSTALSLNTWHHICATRYGNVHKIFLNGVVEATATVSHTIPSGSWRAAIADVFANSDSYRPNCYLYDARITKGIARYTANFSLPIARFNAPYSLNITINESIVADNFIVYMHELKTGIKRLSAIKTAGTYDFYLPYKEALFLSIMPIQGDMWKPSTVYAVNDLVFPTTPETIPYYYKRIASGTSSATTEPTWSTALAGQCNDGSVTNAWERVARLTAPSISCPLIPA
jgi:hypothetical protein